LVVSNFDIGVESDLNLEGFTSACFHSEGLINLEVTTVEIDIECLMSVKSKGISVLSVDEFSWEDTHTNEIRSVDSLVALSNHCLDTLEVRAPRERKKRKNIRIIGKGKRLEKRLYVCSFKFSYLAAQSLDDPDPYSFPARTIS